MTRWRCKSCHTFAEDASLLLAESPFDSNDTLHGCPACRQCTEGFDEICDESGCDAAASCGWPSAGAYRRTCYKHSDWAKP